MFWPEESEFTPGASAGRCCAPVQPWPSRCVSRLNAATATRLIGLLFLGLIVITCAGADCIRQQVIAYKPCIKFAAAETPRSTRASRGAPSAVTNSAFYTGQTASLRSYPRSLQRAVLRVQAESASHPVVLYLQLDISAFDSCCREQMTAQGFINRVEAKRDVALIWE